MEDVEIIRGDTATLSFPINNKSGEVIQLADIETLIMTCRNRCEEIVFEKNTENFRFEDNKYKVDLKAEDTEQINFSNPLFFDIEVTLKNGIRKTRLYELNLVKDKTIHGGDNNGN